MQQGCSSGLPATRWLDRLLFVPVKDGFVSESRLAKKLKPKWITWVVREVSIE